MTIIWYNLTLHHPQSSVHLHYNMMIICSLMILRLGTDYLQFICLIISQDDDDGSFSVLLYIEYKKMFNVLIEFPMYSHDVTFVTLC